jgi:anti-sigma28 factor (negative regulator of flagellin synthesis)
MKGPAKAKLTEKSEPNTASEVHSRRTQRIEDLKAAIAEGRYKVDTLAVSRALVRKSIITKH